MASGSGTGTPTSSSSSTTPTAQEIVDAIDLALYNRLTAGGVQDYMINGKRITAYRPLELRDLRKYYVSIVNRNNRGNTVSYAKFRKPT